MALRRVAITGVGIVSALGADAQSCWQAIEDDRCGIRRITRFDPQDFPCQLAAEAVEIDCHCLSAKEQRRLHHVMKLAIASAEEALGQAMLPSTLSADCGVLLGCAIGGASLIEEASPFVQARKFRKIAPTTLPMSIGNTVAGMVAEKFGLQGPNFVINSACASGTHAIGEAFHKIRHGLQKAILTGGCDAPISPGSNVAFSNMKAFNTADNDRPEFASRPFHSTRCGFIIGEGAGLLVLEDWQHAQERQAKILGEVIGYGASADAYHISAPDEQGRGAQSAMRRALQDAGLQPADVDYVNAHGTSTPLNDRIESQAIAALLGPHASENCFVSSSKGHIGHCIGAAGAIEAIISLRALNQQSLPRTRNLDQPDPACAGVNLMDPGRVQRHHVALSNSFGFGGQNGSLLLRSAASAMANPHVVSGDSAGS